MKYKYIGALIISAFSLNALAEEPSGWFIWGRDTHKVNIDHSVFRSSPKSYSIESLPNATSSDRGGLTQSYILAQKYAGKKVRLSGYLKGNNVSDVFIWLFAKETNKKYIEYDTYISGTELDNVNKNWGQFNMVMFIPKETKTISFGFNMGWIGKLWIDDIVFESVPQSTPEEFSIRRVFPKKEKNEPINLP
jgi:AraC family transcriptional regulator